MSLVARGSTVGQVLKWATGGVENQMIKACGSMNIENGRPGVFLDLLKGFKQWLIRQNYAKQTIRVRGYQLQTFLTWLSSKGIKNLEAVGKEELGLYVDYLHSRPIGSKMIGDCIGVLKKLNEYLEQYGEAPLVQVKLKVTKAIAIERSILSREEVHELYKSCGSDIWGVRDEVLLSIYYGCGLRNREGRYLELKDVDFRSGLLHVRHGKHYRERYVPMGTEVAKQLSAWINSGHDFFSTQSTNLLLPNLYGNVSRGDHLNARLNLLCDKAGITKHITLHSLRHSIATHLLQSGMDLEKISQFLGHQSLETTKLYTRMSKGNQE